MSGSTPYDIPRNKYRTISIVLAVLIHLMLIGFFWLSVSWSIAPPLTVEAEVWDAQYKDAAPSSDTEEHDTPHVAQQSNPEPQQAQAAPPEAAQEDAEPPAPAPAPAPTPAPAPEPQPAPKPAVQKEDPDIALQKKRKEEAEKKAELAKEQAAEEAKKQAELKKQQEIKLAQQKADDAKKKAEADKQAQLKKEQDEKIAQQKAADEAKKQAELKKQQDAKLAQQKADEEKKKADAAKKQAAADAKAAQQRRQQELQRMMGQAGGGVTSKTSNGSGEASKSQGPKGQSNYASKIALKIRSNTVFDTPPALTNNPAVEYTVELFPDGSVRSVHKTKSSGVPGFDEAVAQAIQRSEPFPPDTDGKVPDSFHIVHRPKDQ